MEKLDFRTDRDELRPVKWEVQKYDGFNPTGSDTFTGYFHGWFKKETNEGPETVFCLVEKEDGTINEVRATLINFIPKSTALERFVKDNSAKLSDLSLNP